MTIQDHYVHLITVNTNGRNGTGAISVPGVKAGDLILQVVTTADDHHVTSNNYFLGTVGNVDDEIYQFWNSDFSSTNFDFVLFRK